MTASRSGLLPAGEAHFAGRVPVIVIGGGGCGLTAALAAQQAGAEVLVLERDASTLGTTAMSTGLIPAAGSRLQREKGIDDSPELFARDIVAKTHGETDSAIALALAQASARTVEWLLDDHAVPLSLVDSFLYPGHSVKRMHGTPNRTGRELMGSLAAAVGRRGIDVLTDALVSDLFVDDETNRARGVRIRRPDDSVEDLGCEALILACCGFAGNPDMVRRFIPEIADATFFGHPGNKGDAIRWGEGLGAAIRDIHSYQGHGGLAAGRGIPILWPLIMEGGYQVNVRGERFSNEARGYSEQAVDVVAQPGHVAWDIYDQRLHELMLEFDDYRDALEARAVLQAEDIAALAALAGIDAAGLASTVAEVESLQRGECGDRFGRDFTRKSALRAPYFAVKVTGALFHTQGGIAVNHEAQVLREDGSLLPNIFAGGGAARGISGAGCSGYMAGNGLLTATTFGRLAGTAAARLVRR
ncbi:MAG: FAD-dependent oxidoreductase [Actinobacteria bacterium]|nr:FAD-dependent oxidoreductase [Actinomycetota bacterium]